MIVYIDRIEPYLRWCLPLSLRMWRVIGMRPAIASIPSEGDVRKVPVIQRAAFHCIFFNSLMFLTIGVPLKNQRLNPYNAMGKMHVLYRSRFCMGSMPHEELPSIFIVLRVERHLVA